MDINKFTEECILPSEGKLYKGILASGSIQIKYPTAEQEDILTNSNYIKQEIVIDKLLQSVIETKGFEYKDLLTGDKNVIMVSTRILLYGKDYKFSVTNPLNPEDKIIVTVDLTTLKEKKLVIEPIESNTNEFEFTTPFGGDKLTFKMLTHGDEEKIDIEIKNLRKIRPNESKAVTTRLAYTILSVNGKRDTQTIREYISKIRSQDSKALREYINDNSPNIELNYSYDFGKGIQEESMPITTDFFWP